MRRITENDTLKTLEEEISKSVSSLEYWGDLDISYEELEIIGELFRAKVQSFHGAVDLYSICKVYPCTLTTLCVFLVRYKYDTNFWGLLSDELYLNFGKEWHNDIGESIKKTFDKYGFDYSVVKDDPKINIAPIIFEACLPPDSSLSDLFYIMNYDSYRVFDPEVIIDDLINMRSYQIRKTLLHFLNHFKNDKAVEFVLEIHDSIVAVDQHLDNGSRYQNKYIEWKEKEKEKGSILSRKDKDRQTKPYLFFDGGNKGLCIILPRIVINNEWVEEVVWTIENEGGFSKKLYCRVFGDDNVRYIESINVAVTPGEKYNITLYDGEDLDDDSNMSWEINGVGEKPLIFNSHGRMINSTYLHRPYITVVMNNRVKITEQKNLSLDYQYYPTDSLDYSIMCISPSGGDACLKYICHGSEFVLVSKPYIDLSFSGDSLFSLEKENFDVELFTDIPTLNILYEDGAYLDDIEIRVNSESYIIDRVDGDEILSFDLKKIISNREKKYGIYSVRIYQYNKFLKQIEFAYVPKIKTNYNTSLCWPDLKKRRCKNSLYFLLPDHWSIDFEYCNNSSDNEKTIVEYLSDIGLLHGTLSYKHDEKSMHFSVNLPVNPFELMLYGNGDLEGENITDKTYLMDFEDFYNGDIWLGLSTYGEFRKSIYSLQLVTANGIEQIENIKIYHNGYTNINIKSFSDTIRKCPLPAQIVLSKKGDNSIPILYINEHMKLSDYPQFTIGKHMDYVSLSLDEGEIDISISRFGVEPNTKKLYFSDSIYKKEKSFRRYYPYGGKMEEGIYIISNSSSVENEFFEEVDTDLDLSLNNNIVYVPRYLHKGDIKYDSKKWLDKLLALLCKNNIDNSFIINSLDRKKVSNLSRVDFDDYDIEKLVAIACFADSKISNDLKSKLKKIMRIISVCFLQRGDRIKIIEFLVKINVSQSVFDICLENYSLLLFYGEKNKLKKLASEALKYSVELSMMLAMAAEVSVRNCLLKEQYRDLIGKESIKNLLRVPYVNDRDKIVYEQKQFIKELPSNIKISLDDSIVGCEKDIHSMFTLDKKGNSSFDISLKPDSGIYFAHIKYIDQYINWYKLNCDENGVKKVVQNRCEELFKNTKEGILKAITVLESNIELSDMTRQYKKAMSYRCSNPNVDFYNMSLYFYIQGLAAFLSKIPMSYEKYDKYRTIGIDFMSEASEIAPRLSKRDILMAGTFVYLKRKEELLCQ